MTETTESKYVALCATGLEDILTGEVRSFGGKIEETSRNTVSFYGDDRVMCAVNMGSRTALHLLKFVKSFFFNSTDELYQKIKKISWERYFTSDKTMRIDLKGSSRVIDNTHFAVLRIKDGIADHFRECADGVRPSIDKERPQIQIIVYVNGTQAIVYLDSSGLPLFKRGYRVAHGPAPLKEDLAAGILLLAGYDGKRDLIDPMCGSGTFLFEAYMIACNISPNLEREFAFMHWLRYDDKVYRAVHDELKQRETTTDRRFIGYDSDGKVLRIAENIKKNSFDKGAITFTQKNFRDISDQLRGVMVVTNPPYGERLQTDSKINSFYKDMGDFFKQMCADSKIAVFTANLEAAKSIGLRTSSRVPLYNGPLEARLLTFDIF